MKVGRNTEEKGVKVEPEEVDQIVDELSLALDRCHLFAMPAFISSVDDSLSKLKLKLSELEHRSSVIRAYVGSTVVGKNASIRNDIIDKSLSENHEWVLLQEEHRTTQYKINRLMSVKDMARRKLSILQTEHQYAGVSRYETLMEELSQ